MADLSNAEVKSLARAVGLDIEEPLLTEVAFNLNALRDLMDEVNPENLDQVEPLPIIPIHERSSHEHG
jgi:Asp-tRNA(Asn)/Glu-tRNA(Gln) amidotransferase C subunit